MFIRIETSSGIPITRQIMDQIRAQCAAGSLKPGERLPSVRVLARELAVNQNTILRVYEKLTIEGLLERRHGDGTYITQNLAPGQLQIQRDLLRKEVIRLVQRASTLGMELAVVQEMIEQGFRQHDHGSGAQKDDEHV